LHRCHWSRLGGPDPPGILIPGAAPASAAVNRIYTIEAEAVANCSYTAAGLSTLAFNMSVSCFAILEYV